MQNLQVQEDLSEHPANHPSLGDASLTQQGKSQPLTKTPQQMQVLHYLLFT